MTFLKQSKLPMIFGTVLFTIALAYGGTVYASHSFEVGTSAGSLPDNTHIRLDGMILAPGAILPVYDASPNFVSGHFLLKAPCEVVPGDADSDTYRPTVTIVAGHVDEDNHYTHMEMIPLFYIAAVSDAPNSCIWHAHVPDPLNGGSLRVTDIDLINLSGTPVEFNAGDIVDINIQSVLGNIGSSPYADGPFVGFGPEDKNPVYDLNDADLTNDGLGHS